MHISWRPHGLLQFCACIYADLMASALVAPLSCVYLCRSHGISMGCSSFVPVSMQVCSCLHACSRFVCVKHWDPKVQCMEIPGLRVQGRVVHGNALGWRALRSTTSSNPAPDKINGAPQVHQSKRSVFEIRWGGWGGWGLGKWVRAHTRCRIVYCSVGLAMCH